MKTKTKTKTKKEKKRKKRKKESTEKIEEEKLLFKCKRELNIREE